EEYIEPYDDDPWALPGMRQGSDGFVSSLGTLAGGAIFFEREADSRLEDCIFSNNAGTIGSAVYADPNVTLQIQHCEFSDHIGGAVFTNRGSNLLISNSLFLNNDANQLAIGVGGAVTIGVDAAAASIVDCNFVGNSTIGDGGAVLTYSDMVVENSEFMDNAAASDGGAFYAYHAPDPVVNTLQVDFRNCEFNGNEAQALGGAGFAKNTILTVEDSKLLYNKAASGGALRLPLGDLTMNRCMVFGNEATGTSSGGEGYGGGVHVIDGPFVITDSRFEVNRASAGGSAGGGLCVTGSQTYFDQNLLNCLFAKNSTSNTGGGIACLQYVDVRIDNCTIADNVSLKKQGGGVYLDFESSVSLNNSIVSGNKGFGIYEKRPNCQSTADYTLFYGNSEGDLRDGQSAQSVSGAVDLMAIAGYTNVFDSDPQFVSGPWGAYYLTQLSSNEAYNGGSMSAVDAMLDTLTTDPADMLDQDAVDLGYHYDLPVGEPEFTLTASVVNDRWGSVEPTSGIYLPYAVAQLTAIPDPNYQVYLWTGSDDDSSKQRLNAVLMVEDRTVMVEFEGAGPKNRFVPDAYATIEEAMAAARSGDRIVLSPRSDQPYTISDPDGINFGGKQLVFTSVDPDNPDIVAQTIIDCKGTRYNSKRAFHFDSGEDASSIIQGITIRNAFTAVIGRSAAIDTGRWPWHDGSLFGVPPEPWDEAQPTPDPLPPFRALSGEDGIGDSYGGAILVENGSSPTIRKCVFEKCTVAGGIGGDGANGLHPSRLQNVTEDLDSQSGGHSGKGVGNGYGGAIAVRSGSSPQILNCEFKNNRATGGWGGIPGNAGTAYNAGRWGWGGNDGAGLSYAETYTLSAIAVWEAYAESLGISLDDEFFLLQGFPKMNDWPNAGNGFGDGRGGAIFVESGSNPTIYQCRFEDNYVRPGYVSAGGKESPNGDAYPEPFDGAKPPVAWGQKDARSGGAGFLTGEGSIAGGAVFYGEDANSLLVDCEFVNNSAYSVFTYNDPSVYTQGGAVHMDLNSVLRVEDCNFVENVAGALFSSTGGMLIVEGCGFTNNRTDALEEQTSSVFNPDFIPITDQTQFREIGGAITIDKDAQASASISDCRFIGNVTTDSGGAILAYGDVIVTESLFNTNTAEGDGGAFYSYYHIPDPNWHTVTLDFVNCEFSGNEAKGFGGAGYVETAILNMQDCFFALNTAPSGGAVYSVQSDLDLQGLLLYGNEATGIDAGAYRSAAGEGYGGAIFITDGPFAIADTRFENNRAYGVVSAGAGLCVTGSQVYQQQNLLNCLFAGNRSENVGGAVACQQFVDLKLDNCTLVDNISDINQGGGIFVDNISSVLLRNSIVSTNTGYGIYERPAGGSTTSGGNSSASDVLFYGNTSADLFDAQTNQGVSAGAASGYTNILDVNPLYADGPLGRYYLDQQTPSPAVDAGSDFPFNVGLYDESRNVRYTTDPTDPRDGAVIEDGGETGLEDPVDLGYHYFIPDPNNDLYELTVVTVVVDDDGVIYLQDVGTVSKTPDLESYYRGAVVTLDADILDEYYLTGWSGGTFNDSSRSAQNNVLMWSDKDIKVLTRLRRTLNVGTSAEYDTLGDAISDAQDGDIIFVAPGTYTAASQFPSPLNNIVLEGKELTISGANPDDETVVRATVFDNFRFMLGNLDEATIIEGITIENSRMNIFRGSPTIRNCIFTGCRFFDIQSVHFPPVPAGADGYNQGGIFGGALSMYDSSPKVQNCIFENNSVTGADGEDGFAGAASHPNGGDGGWPSMVYGGAVYCGLSSNPEFIGCTFTGNEVFGANGGNGADFVTIDKVIYLGGRGGGWVYGDIAEQYLADIGWDGWAFESIGDKYTFYSPYSGFYGDYDFDLWAKWFNWDTDLYSNWDEFFSAYQDFTLDTIGDPYDQLMDAWRYSGYGGAVYCELDSDATFTDCVFENNQSHSGLTGVGGAQSILTSANGVPWPDRQLNMPTAGGAVFAALDSDVEFTRCTFRNNVADKSTVDLPHTFQISYGGAVAYEFDCEVKFTDCDIVENDATVGGGLYGFESMATIADCNVLNNEAYLGAGVFLDDEAAVISGSRFEANQAKVPEVVVVPPDPDEPEPDPDEPVVPAGTLDLTGEGAGVFAHVQDLQIRDSIFLKNRSQLSGGGLLLSGTVAETADIFNCLFVENTAKLDGAGASVNWTSQARFGNCTFADNVAVGIYEDVETGEFEVVLDPETGEPVLDDDGNPVLIPITTSVQLSPGKGGGLNVSYDSIAEVIDSIFWGNLADRGESVYLGTSPAYERPSELTISYSDVANYPSANAIYVEDGCTFNPGAGIFSQDPVFATLSDASVDDVAFEYYLNQQASPCIDAGSDFASSVGLSNYTTSIFGALDKGQVDIGYHYQKAAETPCRRADLILNGIIELEDLAKFASEWLSVCGEGNSWCDGADQNFDTEVDFQDYVNIAACWQETDDEAPFPDPAEWEVEPFATPERFDKIEMTAKLHHDLWFPDEYVKYRFYSGLRD
ncbi:MAG: right-handed parallel beta-helix repeat-containing protein, partial [Planctomycetota bacterium]